MKKYMIIGLGPEYNYPGDMDTWGENNTRYASNHGASLISRSLLKQFNADYVDNFDDYAKLNEEYDGCIIAFATHITHWRDVSLYTDIVRQLNMPIYAFSLGVQDYTADISKAFRIHPSMLELLNIVSEKSRYIGVRGYYTASILMKNGFDNIIPIGCPTLYWNMDRDFRVMKKDAVSNKIIVYHRTLASESGFHLLESGIPIVGQDFLDEAVFTSNLSEDRKLIDSELAQYEAQGYKSASLDLVEQNGVFFSTFSEWFDFVGKQDFVIGPRLHGCIAGIIQNVPAVLLTRDLRTMEIAEFFQIPSIPYTELKNLSLEEIIRETSYRDFNVNYRMKYDNYLKFLEANDLDSNLMKEKEVQDFSFTYADHVHEIAILHRDVQEIKIELENYRGSLKIVKMVYDLLRRIPFLKRFAGLSKK